jgi:hypothetical protein
MTKLNIDTYLEGLVPSIQLVNCVFEQWFKILSKTDESSVLHFS